MYLQGNGVLSINASRMMEYLRGTHPHQSLVLSYMSKHNLLVYADVVVYILSAHNFTVSQYVFPSLVLFHLDSYPRHAIISTSAQWRLLRRGPMCLSGSPM